ncbi:hypothetical protein PINS_up013495 [Pythium insidiosum]|nr:hypothetical protein PINS_up013495 [Pythium insidiosum]
MFLQWIAKCELVPVSADSHVLKKFSEKCQRTLCSMVVGFLTADNVDVADVLPSGHHIRWSMEIIGQSFALSLEDADVIAGAIRLYEQWLGVDAAAKTKDKRPSCMQKVEQTFIQDLLAQMTLLFEERPDASRAATDTLVSKHVQLCLRSLKAVAKRRGPMLSPQTWDRMIRLLIGAADGVLHSSRSVLGNHLCGPLVRILIELYLRSLPFCGPRGELWGLLQKFYRRWTHRLLVIEQWNAATLALTRALIRHLHSLEPSKNEVDIAWADGRLQSKFEFEASLLVYAWYRVLRVVGHPSGFSDPDVYLAAIKGISRLTDELTRVEHIPVVRWDQVLGALGSSVGVENRDTMGLTMISSHGSEDKTFVLPESSGAMVQRTRAPPDVNTILRLLGPWLFDASLTRSQRFTACRSEALRCLGKLVCGFSSGRSKRINWAYSMRCLMALQTALMEEDDRTIAAAVFNWSRIFGLYGNHTLRGASVITGPFHRAVDRLLRVSENEQPIGGVPVVLLRRSCIEACSSLLTLHTHLPRALIKEAEKTIVPPAMTGLQGLYSTLPKHTSSQVVALLMNAIKVETDPTNQQMILWLLTVAIQQEAIYWSKGLASSRNSQVPVTILLICSMLSKASRYKAPVIFTAFECLHHLAYVCDELYDHAMNSVVHLMHACCDFIISNSPMLRSSRAPFYLDELMSNAYGCITEWILVLPMLLSKNQVVSKVISTIVDTMERQGVKTSAIRSRDAAQKLLTTLMKNHAAGAEHEIEGADENSVLQDLCAVGPEAHYKHCRFFAINKSAVMTVIEKMANAECASPETIVIMRDATGRYAWRTKPRYCDGPRLKSEDEFARYVDSRSQEQAEVAHSKVGNDQLITENTKYKDPLLHALRSTSQAATLLSWQSVNHRDSKEFTVAQGEGNTGLTSSSERKVSAAGRDERELHDQVFAGILANQSRADDEALRGYTSPWTSKRLLEPQAVQKDVALESWEVSRRMMTEFGFLSVRNWGSVFAMKAGSNSELLQQLHQLDRIPTRNTFEFAVVYTSSRSSEGGFDNVSVVSCADIELGITDVSRDYEAFLSVLGDRMRIDDTSRRVSHFGGSRFTGDVVFHSTNNGDMCFFVPTLPIKYRDTNSFVEPARLAERANVLIVWNETQLTYRPGSVLWASTFKLPTPSSQVVILIDPLGNDLYCVRISHEGSPLFNHRDTIARDDENYVDEGEVHCARVLGPLQDGMVVNGAWLAPLVRQTAMNAATIARAFHRYQHSIGATTLTPPTGPEWLRQRQIAAIVEKYMHPQLPSEFYSGLFTDVESYAVTDQGISEPEDDLDSYGEIDC